MVSYDFNRNCTLKKTIEFVVLAIILLADSAIAENTIWDEGSGSPLPYTWNYSNFDEFNIGTGTENFSIIQTGLGGANRTIRGIDDPEGAGLFYTSTRKIVEFEVSKMEGVAVDYALNSAGKKQFQGKYYATVNLFGEPYVAINGEPNNLSKIILEQKNNEQVILSPGEIWYMGEGWTLTINAIDSRTIQQQVWFTLKKDENVVDEGIVQAPPGELISDKQKAVYVKTKTFPGQPDVPIFVTYIEKIFPGSKSDFVVMKHTWLISSDIFELYKTTNIDNLILTSGSPDGLAFGNKNSIVLTPNTTINLAGNLNLKVIDNATHLKFYPSFGPKLNITASKTNITMGNMANVTFSVTENGSGVFGANISLGGAAVGNGITDTNGQVTMIINATYSGTIIVKAAKSGYAGSTTMLQVDQLPMPSIASWNLEENYVLNLTDIGQAFPGQIRLQLIKNGTVVKDSILHTGETFDYCPDINCIFDATADSIFRGHHGFFIRLLNVRQLSESNGSNLPVDAVHIFKSFNFSGISWQLDEGYELKLLDIDFKVPRSSYFEIVKNNETIDEVVLYPGQTYYYNNLTNILHFQLDQIFSGKQGHLVRLINVNQSSEINNTGLRIKESHIFKSGNFTGMSWQLEDGYTLRKMDIDADAQPHIVWLELLKNDMILDDGLKSVGQTYYYNNSSGSIILKAGIDGIFDGKTSNIVKLSEIDQFSDTNGSILLENYNHSFKYGSVNASTGGWEKPDRIVKIVRIRGEVVNKLDSPYTIPGWNDRSFAGFYYDFNNDTSTEILGLSDTLYDLELSRIIEKGHLWYNTTGVPVYFKAFENESLNIDGATQYRVVGWQSEKWVGIKDKANKIARLAFEMGKNEKKTLTTGETWSLGAGYELTVNAIDARTTPRQAWITLKKDGAILDEGIVQAPQDSTAAQKQKAVYKKTKTILGESDALLFTVYVDDIYGDATSDFVQFKYAWLMDESTGKEIKSGDKLGVFEVRSADQDYVRLSNENIVNLSRDTVTTIMGNLNFSIADSDELRFYPFVEYTEPGTYEIRGNIFSEDTDNATAPSWDAQSFAGFYYDFKYGKSTETLALTSTMQQLDANSNAIDKEQLWYNTTIARIPFKANEKENVTINSKHNYSIVGLQGEKWIGINDKANKIAKLALEMGTEEKKTLTPGETWSLGEGYYLTINDIEARTTPRQVWFTLRKNGEIVDEFIGQSPEGTTKDQKQKAVYAKTKTIQGESDSLLFAIYVDTIFSGATSDMVQFKYAWLMDESSAKEIKSDDKFGVFDVKFANDQSVNLSNNDSINLKRNEEVTLMGEVKFKVADSDTLRFYPKVDVEIFPSDTTPPIIDSVTLDNNTPKTGNSILVTVKATDNIGVKGVKANNASLTIQGGSTNTWSGTITALDGVHSVNVSANDAAGNIAYNNSTGYSTIPGDEIPGNGDVIPDLKNATIFKGNVTIDGNAVPDGTTVEVKNGNVLLGSDNGGTFEGHYHLAVFPGTMTITFYINGIFAQSYSLTSQDKAKIIILDISITTGGRIAGMKFNDSNGNRIKDPGESGLSNWTIVLKNNSGYIMDTRTTDQNGNYVFSGLAEENYTVEERPMSGWTQTFPELPGIYQLILKDRENKTGVNFGNSLRPSLTHIVNATRVIEKESLRTGESTRVIVRITDHIAQASSLQESIPSGWAVNRVSDDADVFKNVTFEWVWSNVTPVTNRTVIYTITAPLDAASGTYYINGTIINSSGAMAIVNGNNIIRLNISSFDIYSFYRRMGHDPQKVETTDLLKAMDDWRDAIIPPGFNRPIMMQELSDLINEWAMT